VRRATPATLTGVSGRPTLACALSIDSVSPSFGDQFAGAKNPVVRTAAAKSSCFGWISQLQNGNGVILQLSGPKVGAELSAAVGGVTIRLK
jgi:hypothetical protein